MSWAEDGSLTAAKIIHSYKGIDLSLVNLVVLFRMMNVVGINLFSFLAGYWYCLCYCEKIRILSS